MGFRRTVLPQALRDEGSQGQLQNQDRSLHSQSERQVRRRRLLGQKAGQESGEEGEEGEEMSALLAASLQAEFGANGTRWSPFGGQGMIDDAHCRRRS
ncbi:MAG: hypothetical protein ACREL7_12235 [Longimicrobiales bacterium]